MKRKINVDPQKILAAFQKNGVLFEKRALGVVAPESILIKNKKGEEFEFSRSFNMFVDPYSYQEEETEVQGEYCSSYKGSLKESGYLPNYKQGSDVISDSDLEPLSTFTFAFNFIFEPGCESSTEWVEFAESNPDKSMIVTPNNCIRQLAHNYLDTNADFWGAA